MSGVLQPDSINALDHLQQLLEEKDQLYLAAQAEIQDLRSRLQKSEEARHRAAEALKGEPAPAEPPTISLPTLNLEEFAPAISQPGRHVNPLTTNGSSRNPLADSFVL